MSLSISLKQMMMAEVYETNITHNLGKMASEAGIYNTLWRPREHGYIYAKEIIKILSNAVEDMERRPDYYKQFNSENGWGVYEDFLPWLKSLLKACKQYPDSEIEIWR